MASNECMNAIHSSNKPTQNNININLSINLSIGLFADVTDLKTEQIKNNDLWKYREYITRGVMVIEKETTKIYIYIYIDIWI